jgi:hypothetical protein
MSSEIIVFHRDLIKYLPKNNQSKVHVASFGDFQEFFASQHAPNLEFDLNYKLWLKKRNILNPNIIFISTAKKNNLKLLFEAVSNNAINCLVINPKNKNDYGELSDNIFFYREFVNKEVYDILNLSKNIIGYVGHDNISVPTSIYMYATYNIPIIAYDVKPVNSIITKYELGITIKHSNELENAYKTLIDNYEFYVKNLSFFLQENSWEKSALVHKEIFI